MKKRLLTLFLSATMILSMVGCGSTTAPEKESTIKESTTKESSTQENKVEVKEEPAQLRLIMYGDMGVRREEFFKNEFKEAVLEDLNIDVSVEFLSWGSVVGDVQNRLIAGEKFAYMHIPTNGDTDQAERGLCAVISEEDINTYMPEYLKKRGTNGFECVKYNGDIVAIPMGNKAYAGNYKVITVLNNILNEVGFDAKEIKTYDQLMEACEAVHAKYPDMRIVGKPVSVANTMDAAITGHPTVAIMSSSNLDYVYLYEDEVTDKVYSYYESESFEKAVKLAEELYQKGYVKNDLLSDPSAITNDWKIGNLLIYDGVPGNIIEPGVKAGMPEGTDLQNIDLSGYDYYYKVDYDWAFSISVAAQDDVADYLRLFNWIYANEDNYNFCIYGVEGKDWERNADGSIKKLTSEMMFDDWFLQASCYHKWDSSLSEETIQTYMEWDKNAKKSKVAGFVLDITPVASEKAALDSVVAEFIQPLRCGYGNYDKDFPDILQKLKDAGLDEYVAEFQKQYSAWYAENMK